MTLLQFAGKKNNTEKILKRVDFSWTDEINIETYLQKFFTHFLLSKNTAVLIDFASGNYIKINLHAKEITDAKQNINLRADLYRVGNLNLCGKTFYVSKIDINNYMTVASIIDNELATRRIPAPANKVFSVTSYYNEDAIFCNGDAGILTKVNINTFENTSKQISQNLGSDSTISQQLNTKYAYNSHNWSSNLSFINCETTTFIYNVNKKFENSGQAFSGCCLGEKIYITKHSDNEVYAYSFTGSTEPETLTKNAFMQTYRANGLSLSSREFGLEHQITTGTTNADRQRYAQIITHYEDYARDDNLVLFKDMFPPEYRQGAVGMSIQFNNGWCIAFPASASATHKKILLGKYTPIYQ